MGRRWNLARTLGRDAGGFTLTELLVVILMIAILAAIAFPLFFDEKQKSEDASTKANLRDLVMQVEACYTIPRDYAACDGVGPGDQLPADTGLPLGGAPGEVRVSQADDTSFTVTGVSKAATEGANHVFSIESGSNGTRVRRCTAGADNEAGGCRAGSW